MTKEEAIDYLLSIGWLQEHDRILSGEEESLLKPCPFCGSKDAVTIVCRKGRDGWRDAYYVFCDFDNDGCGAESGWRHTEEAAVECWNRRC